MPDKEARILLEAIALLHEQGYGRLKIYGYIKEGLGAWRHFLFASDELPPSVGQLPEPIASGSIPGWRLVSGDSAEDVANALKTQEPRLLAAARGDDPVYVAWFAEVLARHPTGVLEMESPRRAAIGGGVIDPPGTPGSS